jgi:hypothetical protein
MEVVYKPWETIEIKAYSVFDSVEAFVENATNQIPVNAAGVGQVFWGSGVLFRFVPLAAAQGSDRLTESLLKGRVIWELVEAAAMPEYVTELRVPSKPMFVLKVNNVHNNTLFGPVTKWIGERLIKSKPRRRR